MENMASFPDLRPHRRSAKAEPSAASKTRTRLLLASPPRSCSQPLSRHRARHSPGKKAHDASAFLTREAGPAAGLRAPRQDAGADLTVRTISAASRSIPPAVSRVASGTLLRAAGAGMSMASRDARRSVRGDPRYTDSERTLTGCSAPAGKPHLALDSLDPAPATTRPRRRGHVCRSAHVADQ